VRARRSGRLVVRLAGSAGGLAGQEHTELVCGMNLCMLRGVLADPPGGENRLDVDA